MLGSVRGRIRVVVARCKWSKGETRWYSGFGGDEGMGGNLVFGLG